MDFIMESGFSNLAVFARFSDCLKKHKQSLIHQVVSDNVRGVYCAICALEGKSRIVLDESA